MLLRLHLVKYLLLNLLSILSPQLQKVLEMLPFATSLVPSGLGKELLHLARTVHHFTPQTALTRDLITLHMPQ